MASDVRVTLGLDNKKFKQGLKQSEGLAGKFAGSVKGQLAGIVTAGAFAKLGKEAINYASKVSDLADRTRTTTDEFQAFTEVSREAGVAQEVLERALRNVTIRSQEALDGNKKYGEAMERLGINAEKFNKLSTAEKFETIAIAVKRSGESTEAFADSAQLLGQRAGPQLTEVLRKIADEGMEPMIERMKESGDVIQSEYLSSLDALADDLDKVKRKMLIFTANMIGSIKPFQDSSLQDVMKKIFVDNGDASAKALAKVSAQLKTMGIDVTKTKSELENYSVVERKAFSMLRAEAISEMKKQILGLENQYVDLSSAVEKEAELNKQTTAQKIEALNEEMRVLQERKEFAQDLMNFSTVREQYAEQISAQKAINDKQEELNKLKKEQIKEDAKIAKELEKQKAKQDALNKKTAERVALLKGQIVEFEKDRADNLELENATTEESINILKRRIEAEKALLATQDDSVDGLESTLEIKKNIASLEDDLKRAEQEKTDEIDNQNKELERQALKKRKLIEASRKEMLRSRKNAKTSRSMEDIAGQEKVSGKMHKIKDPEQREKAREERKKIRKEKSLVREYEELQKEYHAQRRTGMTGYRQEEGTSQRDQTIGRMKEIRSELGLSTEQEGMSKEEQDLALAEKIGEQVEAKKQEMTQSGQAQEKPEIKLLKSIEKNTEETKEAIEDLT